MSAVALTGPRSVGRVLPAGVKRPLGRAWGQWSGTRVDAALATLAAGRRPIVVGPWLGEVGFELLYWIPFLEWAVATFPFDRDRLVVVSRGGTGAWYGHVSARYCDVFEFLDPAAFRARNHVRSAEVGEQKQTRPTALEHELVARVAREEGLDAPAMLHPALMYRAFNAYWWGHCERDWVMRRAAYARLPAPPAADRPADLPASYAAVKFYYNDAFPATDTNRDRAARIVRELAEQGPVVSLSTGLRLDDHAGWEEEEQHARMGIRAGLRPSTNLAVQNAIVAGARAWVGTYGGFAYLAPFHGVPARACYSNPAGFSARHLALAQDVFARFAPGLLQLSPAAEAGTSR